MRIEDLGFNEALKQFRIEKNLEHFDIGRVIAEHKERYIVKNNKGEYDAEVTGNLRFSASSREDFPAVGDWVTLLNCEADFAIIQSIFPRLSVLSRRAVGKFGERQIIAANVDFALLLQAADRDFNLNRLERYLTICHAARVSPIIVLTKIDLISDVQLKAAIRSIKERLPNVPVFALSNETEDGYEVFQKELRKGRTYCMLGSSGVGKSTLTNKLSGNALMKTNSISKSTGKGRHITTHRALSLVKNGALLIDNPGMREVGLTDVPESGTGVFDTILHFSPNCKFSDCTHTNETHCAVIEAVEQGKIDRKAYENFLKIEREKEHFDLSVSEKRKKEKHFGKMIKNFKHDLQKVSPKHWER